MAKPSADPKNHLLASLSPADLGLLQPHLKPVTLALRFVLEETNKPIKYIYFPETGFASVVARGTRKREIEVGIVGREGMSGINVVMGDDRAPLSTYMQVAGHGQRMGATDLRVAMKASRSLHQRFLHFAQAFMVQTAHTALANGQAKVEERLARWLLMADDRLVGGEVPLTHEFLAVMLSVRRPGVTIALHLLEQKGLISSKRRMICVKDRAGLKKIANGLYGIPEAEYQRLTGWSARS